MSPGAAIGAIKVEVQATVMHTRNQVDARKMRAANKLRNAALSVLAGPSPSAPGSSPGVRSGDLRKTWSMYSSGGGGSGVFGILSGMNYAEYLENGTYKMAARPYVKKIKAQAMPEIMSIFGEIGG